MAAWAANVRFAATARKKYPKRTFCAKFRFADRRCLKNGNTTGGAGKERKGKRSMEDRERTIRLWFDMWLQKRDLGIGEIFAEDAVYIESWGPEYHGCEKIKLWFDDWNSRGTVMQWDIRQYFHKGDQTVVEWYFRNQMDNGTVEAFEGMSLIEWAGDGKIRFLKEFGCNEDRYDPYREGPVPQFREERAAWF